MAARGRNQDSLLIEGAAKFISFAALLLPLIGVLVRIIAFRFSGVPSSLGTALAVPLTHLIATGFITAILLVAPLVVFLIIRRAAPSLYRVERARRELDELKDQASAVQEDIDSALERIDREAKALVDVLHDQASEDPASVDVAERVTPFLQDADSTAQRLEKETEQVKEKLRDVENFVSEAEEFVRGRSTSSTLFRQLARTSRIPWVLFLVLAIVYVIFAPGWPYAPLLAVAGWLFARHLERRAKRFGVLTLAHTWPAVLVMVFVVAVTGGIGGFITDTAAKDVRFSQTADIDDGWYSPLGSEEGLLHLRDCEEGNLLTVPITSILSIRATASSRLRIGPSLWGLFFRNESVHLGAEFACPE